MSAVATGTPACRGPGHTRNPQIGSAEDGWWARERWRFLEERLRPLAATATRVLDGGCGPADVTDGIAALTAGFTVGCDRDRHAEWRNRPGRLAHVVADTTRLPFRSGAFDLATALDVVEHLPDDRPALLELRRVARPGGHVALTVPAFPGLWSTFDVAVGHHRRYCAHHLRRAASGAGLHPVDDTYFFGWLAPAAWILRGRDRRQADRPRAGILGRLVDRAVSLLGRVERFWLRRRRLPVGTSLWSLTRVDHTAP
jgi:SAM-dependent methyltransferase